MPGCRLPRTSFLHQQMIVIDADTIVCVSCARNRRQCAVTHDRLVLPRYVASCRSLQRTGIVSTGYRCSGPGAARLASIPRERGQFAGVESTGITTAPSRRWSSTTDWGRLNIFIPKGYRSDRNSRSAPMRSQAQCRIRLSSRFQSMDASFSRRQFAGDTGYDTVACAPVHRRQPFRRLLRWPSQPASRRPSKRFPRADNCHTWCGAYCSLPIFARDIVWDLGSGDGRIVITAAKDSARARPATRSIRR